MPPGRAPALDSRQFPGGGRMEGRQAGRGALRRRGQEAAGMASVVLSEAEKLYIVHGVQVPGAGAGRQGAS